MPQKNNLTEGNIFKALVKLAIPIMGTSFLQMAYNMTDMMWIGRINIETVNDASTKAVAAVGTAGFFMWFGFAFILLSKIGAEVGVAQSIGKKEIDEAKNYARNAIQLIFFIGIIYGLFLFIFRYDLIGFFNFKDETVITWASDYLKIVSIGIVFNFLNPVFTSVFNGYGNSKLPFIINAVGLVFNIILDPILINGFGPIPYLGVKGAAIATIISQFIVTLIFLYFIKVKHQPFDNLKITKKPMFRYYKKIIKLGYPVSIQSALFTFFAMIIARIIAEWGETPIAVQKVGSQIESLSWMTAGGFSTAISTFVGQNYGAKKNDRIVKGYFAAISIVSMIGIFATVLLIFGARPIFTLFIPDDEEAIRMGVTYLRILGISQLFMCLEITTGGAFNGLGKTLQPSIVSIIFNFLRVPSAMILSSAVLLGLNGVWWSISISSVLKGIVLVTLFLIYLNRNFNVNSKLIIKDLLSSNNRDNLWN